MEASRRTGDEISIIGDYQYAAFHRGNPAQRFWHDAKYREAERALRIRDGDHVLDAGCGSGVLSARLAERHPGAWVTGVDGNAGAIAFCRQTHRLPRLKFHSGLVDELDFAPGSFQKIVFLEVIEHLYERQGRRVLASFYDLLAPGGRLVVSTPNYNSLWPLIEWMLDTFHLVAELEGEQHVAKYTGQKLQRSAESVGFRCVSKRSINFVAPWLNPISHKLAERTHRMEVRTAHTLGSVLLYAFEKP